MIEIGDTVRVISSGELRHVTGTHDADMYETQIGMDAGTKWFHKGSELELVQKAPNSNQVGRQGEQERQAASTGSRVTPTTAACTRGT